MTFMSSTSKISAYINEIKGGWTEKKLRYTVLRNGLINIGQRFSADDVKMH